MSSAHVFEETETEQKLSAEIERLKGIIARNAMDRLEGENANGMHVTSADIAASIEILHEWKKGVSS